MRAPSHLLLLLLLTLGSCGSCEACSDGSSVPREPGPAEAMDAGVELGGEEDGGSARSAPRVVIRRSEGEVVVGRDGGWRAATEGTTVEQSETVRTSAGARATVALGEGSALDLGQGTEVVITSVEHERTKIRLERGRLGAVLGGETLLQIEGAGTTTVAAARKGRMSIYANGRGLVAIAAESAEIELTSATGTTVLSSGEQAVVLGEAAPEIAKIPKQVFLNVAWPEETATRERSMELAGQVLPGSNVHVNGELATVDETGRFAVQVPLRDGRNTLKVVAEDPLGREVQRTQSVTVRREAPEVTAETEALWE